VVVNKQFMQRHLDVQSFASVLLEFDGRKACRGCSCLISGCGCSTSEPSGDHLLAGEGDSSRSRVCVVVSVAVVTGSGMWFCVIWVMGGFN